MNKVMANKAKTAKAAVKKLPKEVSVEAAAEAKLVAENGDHAQGGFSTNVVASDDNSGGSSGGSGISPVVILGGLAAVGGIAAAAAGGGGEKTIVQPVPTPVPAPTPAPVPAPTYAVAADKTAADEGTTIRFTISGTNAAGKVVSYQLTGSAATAADVSSPLTGTVTLDSNGKAYVDVVVSADKLTEGAEKLNLVLSGGEKVAADVTINDTSLTPAPTAQTFTLTTSVDAVKDFTGGAGDDTFNAPATSATTGAAATTINSGDTIDGGAGKDTLNITATATNNNSLTGLTVSNVEVINISGANNLGATSTALGSPVAGAAQVRVLDIAGARALGEVQSIDFSGLNILTAGTIGIAGTTVALAAGDGPAAIATKVKAALEALTNSIGTVTQAGSKLTVQFKPALVNDLTQADYDPVDNALNVTTNLNSSPVTYTGNLPTGVVVTTYSASNSITVSVNGNDYVVDVADTSGINGSAAAVAAPAAPTVVTTQGVTAVRETNVVTFGDLTTGQSVTVNGKTLTAGTATVLAADVATFFSSDGTLPSGASATGANDTTKFTVGTASTNSVTYTSAAASGPVTNVVISTGAVGGATAPTAPTLVETSGVTAVTEESVVTFGALSAGQAVTVAGRTLTATGAVTAAEVTAFFAAGTVPSNGTASGALTGFNAAAGTAVNTVKFTSSTASQAVADIVVSTAGNSVTSSLATNLNNTVTAVTGVLNKVLAGAVTVTAGDDAGELKLTSNAVGVELPTVTVAQGSIARSSIDAADGATVANAVRTQVAAGKQVMTITVDDGTTANFAGTETFELFVNGVSYGVTAIASAATEANVATAIATAINNALGATGNVPAVAAAVGKTVTVTAPVAGTALPVLAVNLVTAAGEGSLAFSQVQPNQKALETVTVLGDAAVDASAFVGAEQIWLVGSSGSTTVNAVAAGQTIGFDTVTMANTVNFASTVTSGSIASNGSAGTLSVKGNAMTTLALSGTGTASTGLTITDAGTSATTGLDPIKTLNANTSGSTVLNTEAISELTTFTQAGAGGVMLTPNSKLASVTTGAGADTVLLKTSTLADTVGTTIDETINASLTSGAGNDRLVVATTGTGKTTVDAGEGNDTVYLNTIGSGANTISMGAGDDVVRTETVAALSTTKIDGGSGADTLRTSTTAFGATEYATLTANVSGFETLQLSGAVTALDASKVAFTTFDLRAESTVANTITELSSSQNILMARTAPAAAVTGFSAIGAVAQAIPSKLTVYSKGYLLDSDAVTGGNQTVYGDNLNVTMTHTSATGAVEAYGNKLTLSVTALGDVSSTTSTANVTGIASGATITGNLQSIEATLASARGVGSVTAPAALGVEKMANLTVDLGTVASPNLMNLTSLKVSGAGAVTIDTNTDVVAALAKLKTVDLSGMTAFANQNEKGQEWDGTTVGNYANLSTSSVTLDNDVSETVLLGAARDTIVTGSTIAAKDTITGFQLTASAADPLVVDTSRSDVLKIGVAFNASNAAKMTTTASTLEGALLEASAFTVGGVAKENVVFNFGGNTYVYVDTGANGLTDSDQLVVLTGTLNLDLLLQSGVVIA